MSGFSYKQRTAPFLHVSIADTPFHMYELHTYARHTRKHYVRTVCSLHTYTNRDLRTLSTYIQIPVR